MTNLQASIGCAQLKKLNQFIRKKKLIKGKDLIKSNHLVWFLCTKVRNFHTHAKDD